MPRAMHQTTVRFGGDLWGELVRASEREGVSVAQYVREAAIARLARGGALTQACDEVPDLRRLRRERDEIPDLRRLRRERD